MTVGVLAGLILKKPVFVKITSSHEFGEVQELRRLPFFRLRKQLMKRVRSFFVVNPWITKELGTLGIKPEKTQWLPNGVEKPSALPFDKTSWDEKRKGFNIPRDAPVLVYSGRLSREKGLDCLIRSWNSVIGEFPNAQLYILGKGGSFRSIEEEIKDLTKKMNLTHSIHFPGRVEEVSSYLRIADAFVLPSISEGMSNSLLEAMAHGLPCICTDIPACRCVIRSEEEGIRVPVGNEAALSQAIRQVFRDPTLARKLGKMAFRRVEETFEMGKISKLVLMNYQESLSKKRLLFRV
jgi:glycosyltransferase involved in cell wall biosynthesis